MSLSIRYASEPDLSVEDFAKVLKSSTLAERRPVDDTARLEAMLKNADIIITARAGNDIVGVSRAITDYAFCCYLSDLAVDEKFQKQGIGKKLIEETHQKAGLQTSLYLTSAPAAINYYPKIGMPSYPCFGIPRAR